MTGRPDACASTAAMPNSSTAVTISACAVRMSCATSASETRPAKRTVGPATRRSRRCSGPSPTTTSGTPSRVQARTAVSMFLWAISSETTRKCSPTAPGSKRPVSTGGYTTVASRPKAAAMRRRVVSELAT